MVTGTIGPTTATATEANIDAATWKTKMKAMIATAQAAATSRKLTLVQVITS